MGCGNSSQQSSSENSVESNGGFASVKRPKINVVIGSDIQKPSDGPKVIFIFGGPGSCKGRVVDDLCSMFGFHVISAEQIILSEWQSRVPKAVADGVLNPKSVVSDDTTTRNAQDLLKQDPSELTLHWLLTRIGWEIEECESKEKSPCGYLVDLLPNWRYLLKMDTIRTPMPSMRLFEDKHAIAFSLNLAIPAEKLRQRISAQKLTKMSKKQADSGSSGDAQQSDEADSSRTEKRAAAYNHVADPWIQYFDESNRLVTVDVSLGVADLIWDSVCRFFIDLGLQPRKTVNTVVLFGFNDQAFKSLHMDGMKIIAINLCELVERSNATEEELLRALCVKIDSCTTGYESFAVNTVGTCLGPKAPSIKEAPKKAITFLEEETATLDRYIYMGADRKTAKAAARKGPSYKAVSTTEKEVCLFPPDTTSDVCIRVARIMQQNRVAS